MNYASILLLGLPLIAGLIFGWQMKAHQLPSSHEQKSETESHTRFSKSSPSGNQTSTTPPPALKSSDTAEDLLALPDSELYDRFTQWVFGASPAEISTFYQGYRERKKRNRDLLNLLFIAWTKVDPEPAISATRGTYDIQFAYWAWACHDPAKALVTAKERKEGVRHVVGGIGQFHPQWLVENFESIPGWARGDALNGLNKWPDTQTPELTIPFLIAHNRTVPETSFLALARQDPAKAYQILKGLEPGSNGIRPEYQIQRVPSSNCSSRPPAPRRNRSFTQIPCG